MTHRPFMPMLPEQVPQQRLYALPELPACPEGFRGRHDQYEAMPDKTRPRGTPRNTRYLGAVEWAWGPRDSRVDAYYLNRRRAYWLLWMRWLDENCYPFRWCWYFMAWAPARGVSEREAAVYLLMDAWRTEAEREGLDHFFLIDDANYLSIAELSEIARTVWPEARTRKGRAKQA